MLFEAWNCFITDVISENISQHANQYILIIERNFSRESGEKFTYRTDIKTLIFLLCLAGALLTNKQNLEVLWGTDRDGIKSCDVPTEMASRAEGYRWRWHLNISLIDESSTLQIKSHVYT